MKNIVKLAVIGIIAGIILALFLKIIQSLTNNQAYNLLFNTDYIPFLNELYPKYLVEVLFHFITCIMSVIVLFYLLKLFNLQFKLMPYVLIYTAGSSILFPLTALSERTPDLSDYSAWIYWIIGHMIYSVIVAIMINKWIKMEEL
ncbi:hypothetical protein SPD48_11470 [Pseudogracilibacillus sp. SE30717A]|uniref:hypothetical protein n=1 Tax=Pseudogracilibacillus sp. SE30717A TaxID=3098293 RepID=UPI00300DDAE0